MLLAAPFVDTAEAIPRVLSLHLQLAVEISYKRFSLRVQFIGAQWHPVFLMMHIDSSSPST
jgi:hypothetical protein